MRTLQIGIGAGLIMMLLGAVDPLEDAPLIVGGALVATVAATVAHHPAARRLADETLLIAVGVAMMVVWSLVGGFGGASGRSVWWALTIMPYPLGVLAVVVTALHTLRRTQPLSPLPPLR